MWFEIVPSGAGAVSFQASAQGFSLPNIKCELAHCPVYPVQSQLICYTKPNALSAEGPSAMSKHGRGKHGEHAPNR